MYRYLNLYWKYFDWNMNKLTTELVLMPENFLVNCEYFHPFQKMRDIHRWELTCESYFGFATMKLLEINS